MMSRSGSSFLLAMIRRYVEVFLDTNDLYPRTTDSSSCAGKMLTTNSFQITEQDHISDKERPTPRRDWRACLDMKCGCRANKYQGSEEKYALAVTTLVDFPSIRKFRWAVCASLITSCQTMWRRFILKRHVHHIVSLHLLTPDFQLSRSSWARECHRTILRIALSAAIYPSRPPHSRGTLRGRPLNLQQMIES